MDDLIKRAKKIQEQKKQNGSKAQGISFKQLMSLIDTEYQKPTESSLEVTKSAYIGKMGDIAIRDFRNQIELAKLASREQDSPMADLFYELKELKEKEVGLIYNYIAKQK